MARAWVFPGQGSQYVGMGSDLFAHAEARAVFERADAVLAAPLSSLCFDGPEHELRQTRNTQPAIFVHSMALLALLRGRKPDMTAGHSLGEYSALVAAGALDFEDGLRLVRLRGELMQRAGESRPGIMAAIVGLTAEAVEQVCSEASAAGVVQPANLNSPGQIVISGSVVGVKAAMDLAKQRGAKMAKALGVSGAFHSPLMESASEGLWEALQRTPIRDASVPVYTNVMAEPTRRAAEIRELLHRQLTSPVRWEEIVRNMLRDGATSFEEIGPGKVLQGLIKRIDGTCSITGVDKYTDLQHG